MYLKTLADNKIIQIQAELREARKTDALIAEALEKRIDEAKESIHNIKK